jgi:dihydroorotate dehydrogenase electron transfer subunit
VNRGEPFSLSRSCDPSVRSIVPIEDKTWETPSTVTLRFRYEPPARPGQFVMIWLPGDDELPMSLSYTTGSLKGVTIKAMGETSHRVLGLQTGTAVGIRGPYGNAFDLTPKRILVVSGGSGGAVLAPAAEAARNGGSAITVALGATTQKELLFRERFSKMSNGDLHLSTDDGSDGHHGYVTDVAARLMEERKFDALWTCGPEIMMVKLVASAGKAHVPIFCSVEREMKCAVAMCDACAFGPYHVCLDGPVFSSVMLAKVEDFGRFKRDASGRRVRA